MTVRKHEAVMTCRNGGNEDSFQNFGLRPFGTQTRKCENAIKMDLREVG